MTAALIPASGEIPQQTRLHPSASEPDACQVAVQCGDITFVFTVRNILPARRKLDSHTGVHWIPTDEARDPASFPLPLSSFSPLNLDWRSGSSMETFAKRIQQYFDPSANGRNVGLGLPWTQLLQFAAGRVNEFITTVGDLQTADWISQVTPKYLVRPLWPDSTRPTIWYGQGETLKGQLAIGAGCSLCYGRNFAGLITRLLKLGLVYVDYEDDFYEFSIRVSRIANGLGVAPPDNLRRFDPRGRLFVDIAEQLKQKVMAAGGADGLIVDSAIPAVGGDANSPEPVGAFFNALAYVNIPPLVIAHETKEGNDNFPFGSQLWRTLSAATVNFQASAEPYLKDGLWTRDVLLRSTKMSHNRRFTPLAFHCAFTDDEASEAYDGAPTDRPLASTFINQVAPDSVSSDLHHKLGTIPRVISYLRDREEAGEDYPSIKDIAQATGLKDENVYKALVRNTDTFVMHTPGQRGAGKRATWRLLKGGQG